MRVAVLAMKGGVAKTTTAVALSLALAARDASVLLVDCDDPQWSATEWVRCAEEEGDAWPGNVHVQQWSSRLTRSTLDVYDHVVFDLGPKRPEMARSVLRLVDTVIVPTAPRVGDLRELQPALDLVAAAQSRHDVVFGILLTFVRLSTRAGRNVRAELESLELPVFDTVIPLAEQYAEMNGRVPHRLGAYGDLAAELSATTDDDREVSHAR